VASASIEDMQEMVGKLQRFASDLESNCSELVSAVSDCVDNMNDDKNVLTASSKVSGIVNKIKHAADVARQIAAQLQQEIQRILETQSTISSED
jgi:cysteinyl-tRNA synthetase